MRVVLSAFFFLLLLFEKCVDDVLKHGPRAYLIVHPSSGQMFSATKDTYHTISSKEKQKSKIACPLQSSLVWESHLATFYIFVNEQYLIHLDSASVVVRTRMRGSVILL